MKIGGDLMKKEGDSKKKGEKQTKIGGNLKRKGGKQRRINII